tara:strand:- start:669 stop:1514 length:846 start_codon:yes stop_codon:yes gene_type:complete
MRLDKIKSYAKLNLALNIIKKNSRLHKIETLIAFTSFHDEIFIKEIKSKKHNIIFVGKFSQKINKSNSVSKLIEILEKKQLLKNKRFKIKINKKIPIKAGLGGGSMNAASILRYFIKKKIIKIDKSELHLISNLIGSDVILGLKPKNSVYNSKNKIKSFTGCKKFYALIVKPNFGCSTKEIYSKVRKLNKPKFNNPIKKMFNMGYLKKMENALEEIAFSKYKQLKKIKSFLENLYSPIFVRMTGSGSAIVAYFLSKKRCDNAKKIFNRKYKNYWCIVTKTI